MSITTLTTEQERLQAVYRDRYIEAGLRTSSSMPDLAEVTRLIGDTYRAGGLEPPAEVRIVGCPLTAHREARRYLGSAAPAGFISPATWGTQESGWLSFYRYMYEVLGVGGALEPYTKLSLEIGWGYLYPEIAIISALPTELHMTPRGGLRVLHREGGPAVVYGNGKLRVHCLNGVTVPSWLAETPAASLDVTRLAEISNAQVRTEFIKKVGIDRAISQLKATTLDSVVVADATGRDHEYDLIQTEVVRGSRRVYLAMINPSTGERHLEPVDPSCDTVESALAYRAGGPVETYTFPTVLT